MSDMSTAEKLMKSFEDFKQANDQRLAQLEKNGVADPLLVEKVEKINADVTKYHEMVVEAQKRNDDLERRINLEGFGGQRDTEMLVHAMQFQAQRRGVPIEEIDPSSVDMAAFDAYRKAQMRYWRRGDQGVDVRNAMEVGSDPAGGYWVTPDTSGRIVELIRESSPVRALATVETTTSDALEGGVDIDDLDAGWVGEKQARPETSTPELGEYRIPVMEQYAMPKTTQKMLDNASRDVEGWLIGKIGSKFGRQEATAFVLGDGNKRPRGFLTYPHGIPSGSSWRCIERIPSGAAGGFHATNPGDALITAVYTLKSAYRPGAVFAMNRLVHGEVRKLKDGEGNYLWQPDFTKAGAASLVGFPVVDMEDMPTIAGNSLSIAFGNFREAYTIVDGMGIRVLRDPYTQKGFVLFYSTRKVGGDVVNFDALKLIRFATTANA